MRSVSHRPTLAVLTAASVLVLSHPAAAQEAPAPNLWDVRLEFGLNGASGNSSFTILRGGFSAKRVQTDLFELDLSAVIRYGRNDETVIADDKKGSIKFDWHPQDVFSPFVFVDAAQDAIRRLDFKSTGGFGAKWRTYQTEASELSLSLAGIYDYQNFAVVEGSGSAESEGQFRWSLRLKGEKAFGNGASFEHVTFYQPVYDSFSDYVIEITNSISTSLLGDLSLAVEHLYLRDSAPPPGATPDDQKYSVLFRLAL